MPTIKLIIEYDGTNYSGWQIQPNGVTIQEVLEEGILRLLGEPTRLRSSGRTDAGVHARAMVAIFTTSKSLPLTAYSHGLTNLIPADIAVRSAEEVPSTFNPRADALGKLYRYTILNAPIRSPLNRHTSWLIKEQLNLAAMREAARLFLGEHDFHAFQAANCAAKSTVRTITAMEITAGAVGFIFVEIGRAHV